MKLNKFHSLCINHAHRIYDMHKNVPAVVFALKPNGDVLYLCRQFGEHEDKIFTYNMYASIMQFEKIRMYSFISEMWFYKSKTDSNILPSEHPDRQAGLFVISKDKNKTLHNLFKIVDEQLIDEDMDFDSYKDYIDLFGRLPKMPEQDLKMLLDAPKPDWYAIVKHIEFINVAVDA